MERRPSPKWGWTKRQANWRRMAGGTTGGSKWEPPVDTPTLAEMGLETGAIFPAKPVKNACVYVPFRNYEATQEAPGCFERPGSRGEAEKRNSAKRSGVLA